MRARWKTVRSMVEGVQLVTKNNTLLKRQLITLNA